MDSSKLSFKIFASGGSETELESFVPAFHSWIQSRAIPDHLLIDVADYSHVHHGPGIVLVSYEANFSLDTRGGRLGVTYQRKQPLAGSLADRIRDALRPAIQMAQLLETRLKFKADEIEFRVCDRLAAPNKPETFAAVKPALLDVFPGAQLTQRGSPTELFEVAVKPAGTATLAQLLAALPSPVRA